MELNATLFGQMITFSIFVVFTMKMVWPGLEAALNERKQNISSGLAAAEQGRHDLAEADKKVKEQLAEARSKYKQIVDEANVQAAKILDEAREQAQRERSDFMHSGKIQLEQEVKAARDELQNKVAELVVLGVSKIVGEKVSANDHQQMLSALAKKLNG